MVTATLNHVKDFHSWKRYPNSYYDIGFFASMVKAPNISGYIGSCRSGNASLSDVIDILHYDDDFNLVYRNQVTKGEDPRTFVYKGKPYSLTWDPNYQEILTYKLIDLVEEKAIVLDIENVPPSPLRVLGKNWMPLVTEDELYIVISIDPDISILHCDIESGKCTWVTPFEMIQKGLSVSSNRGGTPLILDEESDLYVGLGHRTYNYYRHAPFLYTLTKDFKSTTMGEDIITGKTAVEDPVSIYKDDGKIYCCINNLRTVDEGQVGLYEVVLNYGN